MFESVARKIGTFNKSLGTMASYSYVEVLVIISVMKTSEYSIVELSDLASE